MPVERARPLRAGTVLPNAVLALLASATASSVLWPVYQSPSFIVLVCATLAIAGVIAVLGAALRAGSAVLALAIVVAYFAFGVPLAVPGEALAGVLPTPAGLASLTEATWASWKQLVTIGIPVGSYQALLVPPFILLLLSTTISLTVALRSRIPEFALLPPLVLLSAAIALGPASAPSAVPIALGMVVILAAWLVWFRAHRHDESIRRVLGQAPRSRSGRLFRRRGAGGRLLLGAAAIVAFAAVAGTAAAAGLPASTPRQVVRSAVAQPFDPEDYPSPLSGFRAYLEKPRNDEPMLTVSGLPADRRIRIATLDTYNGVIYAVGDSGRSSSGAFARVPFRLSTAGAQGTADTLRVTVDGYRGPWVPGSGALSTISFEGADAQQLDGAFYYNSVTGTGAVAGGLRSGDRYTETTIVKPTLAVDQLARMSPGTAEPPRPTVIPDQLDQTLQLYAGRATRPGERLAAAIKGLQANGYISHGIGSEPPSRSGHGADRITQLLTDVPMIGDAEQYAVTAALMARQLGFPARVVFGFVAPRDVSVSHSFTFTGADISAWIEVQTAQRGWVTIDPNPPVRPIPPQRPETPTQISRPQTDVQPQTDNPPAPNTQAPRSHIDDNHPGGLSPFLAILFAVLRVLGWSLLAIAIVCSPFCAILIAKWRRRQLRRRAPGALAQVSGGWQEFTDAALDHGIDPSPVATRREVAALVGRPRAIALASFADEIVFGSGEPDQSEADRVWREVDELRKELDDGRSRWSRFRCRISLRSLGGYRSRTSGEKGD